MYHDSLLSSLPSFLPPSLPPPPQEHQDRVSLLYQLATMEHHPESVPINALVAVEGQLHPNACSFFWAQYCFSCNPIFPYLTLSCD